MPRRCARRSTPKSGSSTPPSYGPTNGYGVNESALADALPSIPGGIETAVIATKGGHTRHAHGTWWIDGSRAHLLSACRASLARLGVEAIDLYQHHRPDPRRPYSELLDALRELVAEGLVRRVGVSNLSLGQLRQAADLLGDSLVSVQSELSPVARDTLPLVEEARRRGIAFLAWGPLGGMRQAKSLIPGLGAFAEVADSLGVSAQRVALAWLLALGPHIIPIPGASRAESILDEDTVAWLTRSAQG